MRNAPRLEEAAARTDWQRELARQLRARCGFRAAEATDPGDTERADAGEADGYLVEVRSKNTGGGAPKFRETRVPEPV